MIWPMLCNDFRSSSVLSCCFLRSLASSRSSRTLASISLCSNSFLRSSSCAAVFLRKQSASRNHKSVRSISQKAVKRKLNGMNSHLLSSAFIGAAPSPSCADINGLAVRLPPLKCASVCVRGLRSLKCSVQSTSVNWVPATRNSSNNTYAVNVAMYVVSRISASVQFDEHVPIWWRTSARR